MTQNIKVVSFPMTGAGHEFEFAYRNHRGEMGHRKACIKSLWFGTSPYYQSPGWFLEAMDLDKVRMRDFRVASITSVNRCIL